MFNDQCFLLLICIYNPNDASTSPTNDLRRVGTLSTSMYPYLFTSQ